VGSLLTLAALALLPRDGLGHVASVPVHRGVGSAGRVVGPHRAQRGRLWRLWASSKSAESTEAKSTTSTDMADDLYVLVHGLAGRPEDLSYLEKCLGRRDPTAVVHLARCNSGILMTFDGIRQGGSRLACEIRGLIKRHPRLKRISLVGNSLGGLYCRYAVGLLFDERTGKLEGLSPHKFLTTATPHLGVGEYGYLSVIPGPLQSLGAYTIMGQTIRELLLKDKNSNSNDGSSLPLLAEMAGLDFEPGPNTAQDTLPFLDGLRAFEERCAYANVANDFLVAYRTAHPAGPLLKPVEPKRDDSGVVFRRRVSAQDFERRDMSSKSQQPFKGRKELMDSMSYSLSSIGWEQVTVAFPGSLPLAHNKICALERDPLQTWINSAGRPVVEDQAKWLIPEQKYEPAASSRA